MKFSKLTYKKQIEFTNERLSYPTGRITSINDLLNIKNNLLFIVISPITNNGNVANTIIVNWKFGKLEDEFANEIISRDLNNDEIPTKSFIYHSDIKHNYKAIECKDLNIIPNNYNNHAVFNNINDANSYTIQRKLSFIPSKKLNNLCILNNLDKFNLLDNYDARIWLTRDEILKYHGIINKG